jgi:light-regulated signal transduction histidine kinase (bacteriophytochrome)
MAAIDELADVRERRDAELQELVYVASHDLTEPLRMVTSYLELLRRHSEDVLDERARQFLFFAEDGAARMRALIDDLLVYSRVGGSQLVCRPTAVADVLEGVLRDLGAAIADAGAEVRVDGELPVLLVDRVQLGQVLQNLLANAVKFHAPGHAPQIVISAAEEPGEAGWWRLTVADDGIGIAARSADRIFRVFQRLHSAEEYPGTGIGLAICRRVVEQHDGRLWVESELGQGSAFHLTLPAGDPE